MSKAYLSPIESMSQEDRVQVLSKLSAWAGSMKDESALKRYHDELPEKLRDAFLKCAELFLLEITHEYGQKPEGK